MIDTKLMFEKLEELINLSETVCENSVLEYKVRPHETRTSLCEFMKDILGLLNSFERPDEDRFLVYGVEDEHRQAIGYPVGEALDDADYQALFDKIDPRPNIGFYSVDASRLIDVESNERQFALFYIPRENFGQIYELKQAIQNRDPRSIRACNRLYEGNSFTREGSRTRPLRQADREKLRKTRKQVIDNNIENLPQVFDSNGLSIYMLAAIFGSWDESNENDKTIIELATNMKYAEWIAPIRAASPSYPETFLLKQSVWQVEDRNKLVALFGANISVEALNSLKPLLVEVLCTTNSKYDLEDNQRYMASIFGKGPFFSESLSCGIAQFMALIGNKIVELPNCTSRYIDGLIFEIMSPILLSNDWRILASASPFVTILAEAAPEVYLILLNRAIKEETALIGFLGMEENDGFSSSNLGAELFLGIRYAARLESLFSSAMSLLIKLYPYSSFAEDTIVCILLPWLPQTEAGKEARIPLGKRLVADGCWGSILKLLPKVTTTGFAHFEPMFLGVDPLPESINLSEFWEVSRPYTFAAIEGSSGSVEKIIDLLDHMNSIRSAGCTEDFMKVLVDTCSDLKESDSLPIWIELKKQISHSIKFSESDWAPSEQDMGFMTEAERNIHPKNILSESMYYFALGDHELFESTDWETSEKCLKESRLRILEELYREMGWQGIASLAPHCKNPEILGIHCAETSFFDSINEQMSSIITEKPVFSRIASGYYWKRFQKEGALLFAMPSIHNWDAKQSAAFFTALPCEPHVWVAAETELGLNANLYWRDAPECRDVETALEANHAISMYCCADRQPEALLLGHYCIDQGLDLDADLLLGCLAGYKPNSINGFEIHYIPKICEWIGQVKPSNQLALQEFRLYPCFQYDEKDIYLFRLMSSDPSFFIEILSLYYKPQHQDSQKKSSDDGVLASRAYDVLQHWKVIPGIREDGTLDEKAFEKWATEVLEKAKELGNMEAAERIAGRCLFHAPEDTGGLFINKVVAEFLDASEFALRGYSVESVNSRGCFNVDNTGKAHFEIADSYETKAKELEKMGLIQFAVTARQIASDFTRHGKDDMERES